MLALKPLKEMFKTNSTLEAASSLLHLFLFHLLLLPLVLVVEEEVEYLCKEYLCFLLL